MDPESSEMNPSAGQALLALREESIRRRGLGRLYTVKAMAMLGRGWHSSGEIMTWLSQYTHTNYVFEIASRWPALVEAESTAKRARIRPKAYLTVSRMIEGTIEEVERSIHA